MGYFLLTLLFFSSMEVVSKPLMGMADPFTLTLHRFFIGFLVLLSIKAAPSYGGIGSLLSVPFRRLLYLAFLGLLNTSFSMSCLQLAVLNGTASQTALIFCSNPLFVFLIGGALQRESRNLRRWAGILLGLVGIGIVLFSNGFSPKRGDLFALFAALSFALYILLSKRALKGSSPLEVNVVSFFFGLLGILLFLLFTGRSLLLPPDLFLKPKLLAAFLYLGIGVSGLAYLTFIKTLERFSALSSSVIFFLKPAFASLFAVVFLSERVGPIFAIGLFLLLWGSLLVIRSDGAFLLFLEKIKGSWGEE